MTRTKPVTRERAVAIVMIAAPLLRESDEPTAAVFNRSGQGRG